jgi:hypothetical protein
MSWKTKRLTLLVGAAGLTLMPPAVRAAEPPLRCEPAGTQVVSVALALVGVKVRLDYPERAVGIPGTADGVEVKARVRDMPSGVLGVPNDEEGHLIVAMVATVPIPSGRILTVELDRCAGAPAPAVERFGCTVEEASDETARLVDGARCTVTLVNDKEGTKL